MTTTPTNPITVAQVRAAMLDIIDNWEAGGTHFGEDMWYGDEDFANQERVTFADAVVTRIAELQRGWD